MSFDVLTALLGFGPTCFGLAQCVVGAATAWHEHRHGRCHTSPMCEGISILKPLHGDEPLLEQALESFCSQNYPEFQIVFGLQDQGDPAARVLRRVLARYPQLDTKIIVDPTMHGRNRKVGNLLNMLRHARHDILVMSDSDIHVAPDYLRKVVATLALPDTGLVTTLYSGRPAHAGTVGQLGAAQINHAFLPGVLMARGLGRQACLGATMGLRKATLAAVGGLEALADTLADDAEIGLRVQRLGLQVRLAPTVPATTVPETVLRVLLQHELRWARTTRALAPVQYGLSALQYPLFWAGLTAVLSGGAAWADVMFAVAWVVRFATSRFIDFALRLASQTPIWLLPLRDLLSVSVIFASYGGDEVYWRGHTLSATRTRLAAGEG